LKGASWKDTAELVGIGAIVASLIFVGLQMRQEQEIARAQALGDYVAGRIDYLLGMTAYADILVKANSGAQLDAVETHTLRNLVQLAEDHAFLEVLRQSQLGGDLNTAELTFASFLYRNPAARTTWLHIADDMERYVDPLRTTESLARTRASGSSTIAGIALLKADDGFHLWSETYDRADGDTFVIQDEIASNVANSLQTEILGAPMAVTATENRNVEAQNLYLVAQAAMGQRSPPDTRRARDLYAQASVLDPDNPRYLAGYAIAVAIQFWNFRDIAANEAITEAGGAIDRALSLGEPSAGTLAAAGLVEELRVITASDAAASISAIALPVDELPVFEALYGEESFRQYARKERYQIAQQARMLASGETEQEIKAQIEGAGFVF